MDDLQPVFTWHPYDDLCVGDYVRCLYSDNRWYHAVIASRRGIGLYDVAWQSDAEEWDGEVATMQPLSNLQLSIRKREIDAYVAAEEFEEWEDACCAMPRAAWEDLEDWEENPEVMARAAWDESQEAQPQNPEPS